MTQPFPPIDLSISPALENGKRYLCGWAFDLGTLRNACDDYTVVRYEPAVPRCGTCDYHADVYSCRHIEGLRIARATDYCSNHSEMAR